MSTVTFRLATPDEQARMSWHAREKYHSRRRAYAKALEAERPKPRHPNLAPSMDRSAIHAIAALLTPLLEQAWESSIQTGLQKRAGRPLTEAETAARKASIHRMCAARSQHWAMKRQEALTLLDKGTPVDAVARTVGVTPRTVYRWRRAAETERTAA